MMRRLGMICLFLGAVLCGGTAAAQHTLGVTGGYGYGNARFYPDQETRAVWGCYTAGVTWRYYGPQRFVGGFGIDFEYLQRGFSFLQNPTEEDPAKYQWYTRRVKSLMLPIVWQPHIYLFKTGCASISMRRSFLLQHLLDIHQRTRFDGISGAVQRSLAGRI